MKLQVFRTLKWIKIISFACILFACGCTSSGTHTDYLYLKPETTVLFSNRSLKVGLDFAYLIGGDLYNHAEATFYGNDRTVLNEAVYSDKHFTIGISIGVEL